MSGNISKRLLSWDKNHKNRSIAIVTVVLLTAAGIILLAADAFHSVTQIDGGLARNPYGKGKRTENLRVDVEEALEKQPLDVEITEQMYTEEEINNVFKQSIEQMDRWILKDNESLDQVVSDMDLITSVPGEPVQIQWQSDRYDVINVQGKLTGTDLDKKGTPVNLDAILTYTGNQDKQALYQCMAMVYPKQLSGSRKILADIREAVKKEDDKTRTDKMLNLPKTIHGKEVFYYRKMDTRGLVLLIMAVLTAALLAVAGMKEQTKEIQKKRKQMLADYPDLINKFTLLLGSGMTAKNAWKKMVADYEKQKEGWGVRYAYEEMKTTWHEMQSGVTEAESYEHFGKRCGLQVYLKLGALLSQNLTKGTRGISNLLKADAIQAFEDRKARARRLGEEAGTKLLFPMFLMLSVVLVIVVVPAFMSMQL